MSKVVLHTLKPIFVQTALQLKLPQPTGHFRQMDYRVARIAGFSQLLHFALETSFTSLKKT